VKTTQTNDRDEFKALHGRHTHLLINMQCNWWIRNVVDFNGVAFENVVIDNDIVYRRPCSQESVSRRIIIKTNGFNEEMLDGTAGLVSSLYSLNRATWWFHDSQENEEMIRFRELYYKMQRWAFSKHEFASQIMRALD